MSATLKTTRRGILLAGGAVLASRMVLRSEAAAPGRLLLQYREPAAEWTSALPLGNGRIGAMVFGGIASERIQVNEATLWGGGPHDYAVPQAATHLAELRQLIFSGQIEAAEALTTQLMGDPSVLVPYQPFCDLRLQFDSSSDVEGYARSLDLDDATAAVTYRSAGIAFAREMFVSHPDEVMVIRLTADQPGKQNLTVGLDSPQPDAVYALGPSGKLTLQGQIEPRDNPKQAWVASWKEPGMRYAAVVAVRAEGGTTTQEDGRLRVRGADAVTILLSGATSFVNFRDISGDAAGRAAASLEAAMAKSYAELKQAHIADYQRLFHRVQLQLGDGSSRVTSTDARIKNVTSTHDPALMALYYQYGRYLLISASRPGGQPANLQGIWNKDLIPAWGSKWTTNINLEMNYWVAENGALWEMQEPLWGLIDDLQVTGAETARAMYNARGWVLHHNTDLWRATAPVDGFWGLWPMGSVWLANQMWDHYQFNPNLDFLRARAYPAMKGAVRFALDFLLEAPAGSRFAGMLVTNPSTSPENAYLLGGKRASLTYAASMDIELLGELFESFASASTLLGTDAELRLEAQKARRRLPPLQIGRRGELQEWIEDYAETEPEHRHVSHLWGLYPGHQISLKHTPKLAAAAKRTLELRGDEGTGWSKAWKAALWARLGEGNRAYAVLQSLIAENTLPNMFDLCPPFQIDGNFGGAAAIAEMLLQSDSHEITLLPALPYAWPEGFVRGLRACGGVAVDIEWRNHKLVAATLASTTAHHVSVRSATHSTSLKLAAGKPVRLNGRLQPHRGIAKK